MMKSNFQGRLVHKKSYPNIDREGMQR